MARLYLFAEGQTEQTFANNVLGPHLAAYGVYLQRSVLVANHRERGRVYRGGGRHYLPMKNDVVRFLKQEQNRNVYFTTMIDVYSLYRDFPGRQEAARLDGFPQRKVEALEAAFANDIGDSRFIPFLQLHEFEAYLFVDPGQFAFSYDNANASVQRLAAIADGVSSPELINDGWETAPSKRIIKEFPRYEHEKRVVGPEIAELIGVASIRAKCPHFHAWISRLEQLGALPNQP